MLLEPLGRARTRDGRFIIKAGFQSFRGEGRSGSNSQGALVSGVSLQTYDQPTVPAADLNTIGHE